MRVDLLLVTLLLHLPADASWWTAGSQVTDPELVCRKAKKLRGRLKKICRGEPALLQKIKDGVDLGMQECQFQFKNKQWNCTADKKSLRKILLRDTKETGFLNAISAAGVSFSVTRACSMGHLVECSCDKVTGKGNERHNRREKMDLEFVDQRTWKWGGCVDNIAFGIKKSKAFLDFPYSKRSDMKTLVRLHNNVAGRLAIQNHMQLDCKCHGMTGSCALKTCWKKMPSFRELGNRLKDRFDRPKKVILSNNGRTLMVDGKNLKPPERKDLVYAENSVDFCKMNRKSGSLGTQGRECNVTSEGEDGCPSLCCGRGSYKQVVRETIYCNCRLKFCCEVHCETCMKKRTVFYCN